MAFVEMDPDTERPADPPWLYVLGAIAAVILVGLVAMVWAFGGHGG